jgi:hypothetical protein
MSEERKKYPGEAPPWELTSEERTSIWETLDSNSILSLAKTLPWQLENLEIQGIFMLSRHLLETGDPWSDPVEQLIENTRREISIQSSRMESELSFPLTSPAEPNSSLPDILDIDSLERILPEKVIQ